MMTSRVALITGSTSGIGLGIAHALASRGYNVLLNGFGKPEEIQAIIQDIQKKHGVSTHHLSADLSKTTEVETLAAEALKLYPCVHVLVNNAGFQHVSPVESFSSEVWERMLAVMLTAPFLLTKALLPEMKQHGWGRIVNISSAHGLVASPNKAAYVTVKHGLVGFTKVVALETAKTGVTCNAICPGYVDTPILQGQVAALAEKEGLTLDAAREKFLANFHATGQPVAIEHIAEAVCFMCSDAGSQVTGSSMVMDGGWTAK